MGAADSPALSGREPQWVPFGENRDGRGDFRVPRGHIRREAPRLNG
jgi:hypothetical protein